MHIYDLDGNKINVTDLAQAIAQVKGLKDLRHEDPSYREGDDARARHWGHIYDQLLKLLTKTSET